MVNTPRDSGFHDALQNVLDGPDWAVIDSWFNRPPRAGWTAADYGDLARVLRTAADHPRMPDTYAHTALGIAQSAQYVADMATEDDLR